MTTNAGRHLTGAAARIDIKHLEAGPTPEVEVSFSASDHGGRAWAVVVQAPSEFLETLTLTAHVVDLPLTPGHASVQVSVSEHDAILAPAGRLTLRLQDGRVVGAASGMGEEFAAQFAGPFVVTCAIPAASMALGAPAPTSDNALPALVVDEKFESPLCQRYATLVSH